MRRPWPTDTLDPSGLAPEIRFRLRGGANASDVATVKATWLPEKIAEWKRENSPEVNNALFLGVYNVRLTATIKRGPKGSERVVNIEAPSSNLKNIFTDKDGKYVGYGNYEVVKQVIDLIIKDQGFTENRCLRDGTLQTTLQGGTIVTLRKTVNNGAIVVVGRPGDESIVIRFSQIKGGSYKLVRGGNVGGDVHHMPADSTSKIPRDDGPAIWMETLDHSKTASFDNIPGAAAYRDKQKQLIAQGKMMEAIQMDIDDVRKLFGNKYDQGIAEMLGYARKQGYIK